MTAESLGMGNTVQVEVTRATILSFADFAIFAIFIVGASFLLIFLFRNIKRRFFKSEDKQILSSGDIAGKLDSASNAFAEWERNTKPK